MKRLLFILVMLLATSLKAGCYDCGCNPAGTVSGGGFKVDNWPEEPIKRFFCCGPGDGTTITASVFVQNLPELANVNIYDPEIYEQDVWTQVWDDVATCHCELTSSSTSFHDTYESIWSGEINTCTTGIQTLTLTVRNTTISLTEVGGVICGEKKNGGCVNSTPCTNTVPMSEMEETSFTLQVDIDVKELCERKCGQCQDGASKCTQCEVECTVVDNQPVPAGGSCSTEGIPSSEGVQLPKKVVEKIYSKNGKVFMTISYDIQYDEKPGLDKRLEQEIEIPKDAKSGPIARQF